MTYYKFVKWDVPPVENCFSSRIPAALLEYDKGNKQPLKDLHIATSDPLCKISGWAFPYAEYMRRFWVKTKYYGIVEMYAMNKTDIRNAIFYGYLLGIGYNGALWREPHPEETPFIPGGDML